MRSQHERARSALLHDEVVRRGGLFIPVGAEARSITDELFVEVILREYESVREESMQSSQHQNRLLQWGATALAGFYTFSFGAWTANPFLTVSSLLFLIPALAATLFTLWLSEVARMKRAGEYVCFLEHKLNCFVGEQPRAVRGLPELVTITSDLSVERNLFAMPLAWEHWLRAPSSSRQLGHLGWKYLYTANALRFAGFLSLVLGGAYLVFENGAGLAAPLPSVAFVVPSASYAAWLLASKRQVAAVASRAALDKPDWVRNPPPQTGGSL